MASVASFYVAAEKINHKKSEQESDGIQAFLYALRIDLLPLLMATKRKMDRLSVAYLKEAEA